MFGPAMGPRLVATAGATADLVFELIQRYSIDCEARRTGWLQGAHCRSGLDLQTERARQWSARGVTTHILDWQQAQKAIGSQWYEGAWLDPRGGTVQPLSYTRGLARAATHNGAQIFVESAARKIEAYGSGWSISTDSGRLLADKVVIGNNAYQSQGLWPGLAQSVVPAYSIQIATKPLPEAIRQSILPGGQSVSETRRVLRYSRLDARGRFIIGARAPAREQVSIDDAQALQQDMLTLFPQLSGIDLEYVWTGCVAMTRDFLPHLHELAPNLYAGLGYNGRGVAMATMMGKLLAQRVRGATAEEIAFPTLPLKPIPFYGLTPAVAELYTHWYDLLDRLKV